MAGQAATAAGSADNLTAGKAVGAAVIGNVLEWYDFSVYAYLATILARQFFPSENPTTALLTAFAAFGIGFVVRPLGGILIGRMGDTHGRKAALLLTIFMMAFGTVAIGLLPAYESIGVLAPVLLVACRLAQGFAAGGEWGGSTAFIVEWAPRNRRGFYGSFQQASVAGGLLLGSAAAAAFSSLLPTEAMESWGWRLPFLLGGLLIPLGIYMRRNIDETPAYREAKAEVARKGEAEAGNWTLAGRAFGFTILWTVSYYVMLNYMPTFTQAYAGLTRSEALWSNSIGLLVLVVAVPLMGMLSDRVGRKPLLLACCLAFVVLTYPLFLLVLSGGGLRTVILVQIVFALMIAAFSGPGPAAISEIFPTASRSTYMSTGYSIAVAVFGGFAPYIATWLIARTGSPLSPTFYLIAAAIVSTLVILRLRETAHSDLA
ncbi:MFS transporter [Siccirubricoccus sp. KC 17139]|uniref:MFS transporter n=1 Tax=Siccirubricoccus soli TaxID=2899147 RepID=A0ABT1D1P0_9PROT|nr:MFS transporter [Siccirubricoccus soli]MCO6415804.1 MFS transporter [Siccirubricoccus soli]MCP2681936.1 MFS transporter [Siccirubricoccus soli]